MCDICLEIVPTMRGARCEHAFCKACLMQHIRVNLGAAKIACPHFPCNEFLLESEIENILGPEDLRKRHNRVVLLSQPALRECPR